MTAQTPKRGDEERDKDGRVWIVAHVSWDGPRPLVSRVLKGSAAHRIEFPEPRRA